MGRLLQTNRAIGNSSIFLQQFFSHFWGGTFFMFPLETPMHFRNPNDKTWKLQRFLIKSIFDDLWSLTWPLASLSTFLNFKLERTISRNHQILIDPNQITNEHDYKSISVDQNSLPKLGKVSCLISVFCQWEICCHFSAESIF